MCVVDWWRTDGHVMHHQNPWVLGHSAGGTVALFGAAVDERIQGCVASGCIGFIRETLLKRRNESGQNTVPGILNWLELDDVVSLVAPRPLLAVTGLQDHLAVFQAVLAVARPTWDELGDQPTSAPVRPRANTDSTLTRPGMHCARCGTVVHEAASMS